MGQKILRLPDVLARKGTSRSTTYNEIKDGTFPKPIQLGARSVGWPDSEVDTVVKARIAGLTNTEIRQLVSRLEAARKNWHQGNLT